MSSQLYKKGTLNCIFESKNLFDYILFKKCFTSIGGTSLEEYANNTDSHKFISIGNYSKEGTYIDNGQRIAFNEKTKDKLLNKNDLVMILNDKTISGDIIGSTILINEDNKYIYNQRSERLICNNIIDPIYAWTYLNYDKHRKRVFRQAQGGTQIYVNFPTIEKMKLQIPKSFDNQLLIGNINLSLTNKIIIAEKQLEYINQLKKGLMQNMFV